MTEEEEKKEQPEHPVDDLQTLIDRLRLDLDEERKRSEDYLTRLKYMQADFENLKKRSDRQIEEVKEYCTEPLIVELLGVVDELELAVKAGRASGGSEEVMKGVEMTLSKMAKVLRKEGVAPIEALGKVFDPSKHNAIARVERDDVDDCTVIEEVRKGYIMKEKVIRPSIVKVAVKPSKSDKEDDQDE
jgi:molecular chaperone GrpE